MSHALLAANDVDYYEAVVVEYLPRRTDFRVAVDHTCAVLSCLAQDAREIHLLFVTPDAQGQRVGTALLDVVATTFDLLRLEVNEQNPSARAFYSAKGFKEVGRSDTDGHGRPLP